MNQIIEQLTYFNKKFPRNAFLDAIKYQDEITPLLLEVIDQAGDISNQRNNDPNYILPLYAMYLLAQFREKKAFKSMCTFLQSDPDLVEGMLGDTITEGLSSILYSTYDGSIEALCQVIENDYIDEFICGAALSTYMKLYDDGLLRQEVCINYLRRIIEISDESELFTMVEGVVIDYHLIEMIPDIKRLYEENKIDTYVHGKYDDFIDWMYYYKTNDSKPKYIVDIVKELESWACFETTPKSTKSNKKMEKMLLDSITGHNTSIAQKKKIGRNDPCPCGSNKKYKHCCIGKEETQDTTSALWEDTREWLQFYPKLDKHEGHISLLDKYDEEAIEIDKLVYLALHHRPVPIWVKRDFERESILKIMYLTQAYELLKIKCAKEDIESDETYDNKHMIHYSTSYWIEEFVTLLNERKDVTNSALLKDIKKWKKKFLGIR